MLSNPNSSVEVIAIAPPLGISLVVDSVSIFFVVLFIFLVLMSSLYYLSIRRDNPYPNESKFFILINMLLASTIGLVLSSDIFNIYVFFEIAGISAYILSAYPKSAKSLEAGIKYLITGAMASIFLVFAIVLIYLHIGTLNLSMISLEFTSLPSDMKLLISLLLLIGFGLKVEIFPLNFWVTDIYQGSDSLINSLFSAVVVKAYLFVFFHLLYLFLPHKEFTIFLLYLGVVSMLVAEIVALRQTHLKRLFAYSSLGQVGMLFVAFSMQDISSITAGLYIVLAHSLAKMVIFLSISSLEQRYGRDDVALLAEVDSPFIKWSMVVAMLSLLGIPLFAGFVGKFLLLKSVASSELFLLLGLIVVASLIESIYYFRVIGVMFGNKNRGESMSISYMQKIVLALLVISIFIVGSAPLVISDFISTASSTMLDIHGYRNLLLGGV
jgi:proton-translocating NADH-quinone oxidoreductase chain N